MVTNLIVGKVEHSQCLYENRIYLGDLETAGYFVMHKSICEALSALITDLVRREIQRGQRLWRYMIAQNMRTRSEEVPNYGQAHWPDIELLDGRLDFPKDEGFPMSVQ